MMKLDELRRELVAAAREQPPVRTDARHRVQRLVRRYRVMRVGVSGIVVVAIALGAFSLLRPTPHGRVVTTPPGKLAAPMPEQIIAVTADHRLVVVASADGRIVRHLADQAVDDTDFGNADTPSSLTVTPDGQTAYFMVRPRRGAPTIASVQINGGAVTSPFGQACCLHNPAVSPDGRWLAYTGVVNSSDGGRDILLYDLRLRRNPDAGIYERRWTSNAPLHHGIGPLAWAADSQHLAFIQNDIADAPLPRVLDVTMAESTPLDQLRPMPWREDAMTWAGYRGSSGELLAILGGERGQVVTVNPTTGTVIRTLFTLHDARQPVPDASGQHVLVQGPDGLYLWSIGDATPHRIAKNIVAATWVPADGTIQGRLMTKHIRGLGSSCCGPIPGNLTIASPDGTLIRQLAVDAHGYSVSLPAGRYLINATVKDGRCDPVQVDITNRKVTLKDVPCVDGISTD